MLFHTIENNLEDAMENRSLYIKIAHWYYTLGMTQDEIAKRLCFTRQKVNKMINSLADMGIVTIRVNGYERSKTSYECALEEHFNLQQVIVSESYQEVSDYLPTLANTAAQYLEDIISANSVIGVSWGKTLAAVISNLSFRQKSGCTVVQMVGAQNIMNESQLKSDEIARSLADKLDCACYMLYAPVVLGQPETKTMLMQEPTIIKAYELMEKCDMALFGIGELNATSTMSQRGYLSENDITHLRQDGFVGDICMNPIRLDGSKDQCFIRNRIISADMEILKRIPNVVAIAGGKNKIEAIIGALSSGVINTLIIDDVTAETIVKTLNI